MSRGQLELADLLRTHEDDLRSETSGLTAIQRRVVGDLIACRTAALGGHRRACDRCGYDEISYNSCRNRHCPKCQASAQAAWFDARRRDLLDVPYFHVVFTLPSALGPLAIHNQRTLYGLLFKAAAETMLQLARDPRHLGGEIGFHAVLHTWGQTLTHHPHVHCVVPGGGFDADRTRWLACREQFFLPVRVLGRLFRGKFMAGLNELRRCEKIRTEGSLSMFREDHAWRRFTKALYAQPWVVYAKPPFAGPEAALKYLARYTHRVAISNRRLVDFDGERVRFTWKDYRRGNARRVMSLDASEFLRRFLRHVLPRGFVRIRHFGFLANCVRRDRVTLARRLIGSDETTGTNRPEAVQADDNESPCVEDQLRCPRCSNVLVVVETIPRPRMTSCASFFDTS